MAVNEVKDLSRKIVDRRSTDGQPTVKAKITGRTKEERKTKTHL